MSYFPPRHKSLPLVRFFTTDGSPSGTNSILNADDTPVTYSVIPQTGEHFEIHSINVFIRDDGVVDAGDYGAIAGGISPGITMSVMEINSAGATASVTDFISAAHPVVDNADWAGLGPTELLSWGTGDSVVVCRWELPVPIWIHDQHNQWLEATVGGTLSGLVQHHFYVMGQLL